MSIPFFYEPNFTALVAPLPAALRIQDDIAQSGQHGERIYDRVWQKKKYEPYTSFARYCGSGGSISQAG